MRPRKWIIAVFLIFTLLSGALYVGKRSLEKNRNLERLLVEYISPAVGGTFEVEEFRIGFFSVDLAGVKLVIPLQSFALKVQDIRIGLSFFKLITSRGDFAKSVNKVIFVNPVIEVSPPDKEEGYRETRFTGRPVTINEFPVKNLLVKNCTVLLGNGRKEEKIVIGEQLTGRIWGDRFGLNFKLEGKLASKQRNLYLTGVLSGVKRQQHISMRIDRASIKKPIRWQNISISKGKLDGVCEFSFSDTTFPYNIDANGWLNIMNGTGEIDGIEQDIKDVNLTLTIARNIIVLDSLTAQWRGIKAFVTCTTGISSVQESWILFRFNGIMPSLFADNLPEAVRNNLTGNGWVDGEAMRRKNSERFVAEFSAGGFSFGENSISKISGECSFAMENIKVDAIGFEYPGLKGGLKGIIDIARKPFTYSFTLAASSDAAIFVPALEGSIALSGEIHGAGDSSKIAMLLTGNELSFHSIALGSPTISMISKGKKVQIISKPKTGDLFTLNGTVDSIHMKQPSVNIEALAYKELILNLLKSLPDDMTKSFSTLQMSTKVTGKLPDPEISGRLVCKGEKITGSCYFDLSRDNRKEPYVWQVRGDKIKFKGTSVPFSASGKLMGDTIAFTTFSLLDGITGSGYLQTSEKGNMNLKILWRSVSLDRVNAFVSREDTFLHRGFISGNTTIRGNASNPSTYSQIYIRECSAAGLSSLEADMVVSSAGKKITILPFVIRKNRKVILSVDTVSNKEHICLSGSFKRIDIGDLLKKALSDDYSLEGFVSGEFYASKSGWPLRVNMHSDRIKVNSWKVDSIAAFIKMTREGIIVEELSAADSSRSHVAAGAIVPWSFLSNTEVETDTMHASLRVTGDLISSLEHNLESSIGGRGKGEIFIDYSVTSEGWHFHEADAFIPKGSLTIQPFVPDDVTNVTLKMNMDNQQKLHIALNGKIDKRPVTIVSSHNIPKGFKPLMFGPIDCGVLQMRTPEKGIDVFVLGFMEREKGYTADIDFAPRKPFDAFTISGPADKPKITGTWILRSVEFTYPLIEDAPFPENIVWDLDVRAGNRKVIYFYNVGGKRRRLIRFTECYLDPSSTLVKVRGSFRDGSFKVLGKIRSYRGFVFYGRDFDRNFKVGLDFSPQKTEDGREYDNMPIIWGTAEAFSDTSRFDRIKITLLTRDKNTGALQEKGRFNDITFRVSSDYEEIPGEAEMDFYREAGLNFVTFQKVGKKAGEMASSFGDQYLNRYLLHRLERRLARRLGLDVVSLETSIASNYFNYFYNNPDHLGDLADKWDYLAFANIGVTVGRYFLQDRVLLKWRTELIPNNVALIPEHNIGFEYQPIDFFWLDFNYGFYKDQDVLVNNPKVLMQLRLPIGRVRKLFDF